MTAAAVTHIHLNGDAWAVMAILVVIALLAVIAVLLADGVSS